MPNFDIVKESNIEKTFRNKNIIDTYELNIKKVVERFEGNLDIDDKEWRWVQDRIEYWNSEERLLTSHEMEQANHYWKKYK